MLVNSLLTKGVQRMQYNVGRVLVEAGLTLDRIGSRYHYDIAYKTELSRHR